jgi:hypothetical protein
MQTLATTLQTAFPSHMHSFLSQNLCQSGQILPPRSPYAGDAMYSVLRMVMSIVLYVFIVNTVELSSLLTF